MQLSVRVLVGGGCVVDTRTSLGSVRGVNDTRRTLMRLLSRSSILFISFPSNTNHLNSSVRTLNSTPRVCPFGSQRSVW